MGGTLLTPVQMGRPQRLLSRKAREPEDVTFRASLARPAELGQAAGGSERSETAVGRPLPKVTSQHACPGVLPPSFLCAYHVPRGHSCLPVNMGGCKCWDFSKPLFLSGPRGPLLKHGVPNSKVVLLVAPRWAPAALQKWSCPPAAHAIPTGLPGSWYVSGCSGEGQGGCAGRGHRRGYRRQTPGSAPCRRGHRVGRLP